MQSQIPKGCPFIPVCTEYRNCSACCLIPGIEKRCEFRPDLRADKKIERMIEMSNSTKSLEKAQQIVSLLEGFSRSEWHALRDSVERAGVSLATRLTNKRRRMADEGVCKSKRDKLNKVDVIADDKKLIEIYLAVVKEMAVQRGAKIA